MGLAVTGMVAAALLAAAATSAVDPAVTRASPREVAALLTEHGLEVEIIDEELVSINSESDGMSFVIFFLNCPGGGDCRTLQFWAGFDQAEISLERINDWNRSRRFGRAYIGEEDGDPALEMDVNLDRGGTSRSNLADQLTIWRGLMIDFARRIDWRPPQGELPKPDCETDKIRSLADCARADEKWKAGAR